MNHVRLYCTWIEGLLNKAADRAQRAAMLEATPNEIRDLYRTHMRQGYDPYNSSDLLTSWVKAGGSIMRKRARGW